MANIVSAQSIDLKCDLYDLEELDGDSETPILDFEGFQIVNPDFIFPTETEDSSIYLQDVNEDLENQIGINIENEFIFDETFNIAPIENTFEINLLDENDEEIIFNEPIDLEEIALISHNFRHFGD